MKLQSSTFTVGLIFVIWFFFTLGCSEWNSGAHAMTAESSFDAEKE